MKCPYYQGVCGLDDSIICYANSNCCNIYKDHEETLKEMIEGVKVNSETVNKIFYKP